MKKMTDWDTEIKKYIDEEDTISIEANTDDIYVDMSNVSTMEMNSENDYSDLIADDVIDLSGILTSSTNSTISITADHEYDTTFDIYDTEKRLSAIEKRLAILEPKQELLDKYELLQSLYEQYKAAEAMLYDPGSEDEQ